MKKVVILAVCVLALLLGNTVYAKDIVYSLNKYQEEELDFILRDPTGFVMAGTYEKNDQNIQVLLLKYGENGNLEWKYSYGENKEDFLYGLSYLYDDSNKIVGYVLTVEETTNEDRESSPHFLLIDLEGKLIREQESFLNSNSIIHKVDEIQTDEGIGGYFVAGSTENHGFIAKYDKNLNLIWKHEVDDASITDAIYVHHLGYYVVSSHEEEDHLSFSLLKYDEETDSFSVIKDDFENDQEPHVEKGIDSYLVYGLTNDVKLSKDQVGSYYLIKYNSKDEIEWDTVGNTPIDEDRVLRVQTISVDEQNTDYYVLSTNRSDHSIEVMHIDSQGVLQEKVKKFKNNYYDIHDFLFHNNSLYFIGQINCPEDDNCDYDANSLFLVCTEDKVIEVKDNDSRYILVGAVVLMGGVFIFYKIRKKKALKQ